MKIFYLPDLGEGLAEAEIREWYVNVGDEVTVDQPLVSMETAKAVVDVPSPYAGKIITLHGKVNDIVQTGAEFISFQLEEKSQDQGSVVGILESSNIAWQEEEVVVQKIKPSSTIKAMPAARLLAKEMNIDLATITPTGPNQMITADDVRNAKKTTTTSSHVKGEALHGVRRSMAQAMAQSHEEIVPVTIFEDANITAIPADADLTVLLLQAIVQAAKAEPAMNAWFNSKSLEKQLHMEVNIGIAMDSEQGLFVPVIKNAATKDHAALRAEINKYKDEVKARKVASSDLQGATFTLSNFGMIAGKYATPIVVPPMVGILACGRSRDAVEIRAGQMSIGRILPLSLTFDHRSVTGGEATRFLGEILRFLEQK